MSTPSASFEIGPRQTVDRALHPELGEGRAVYDNGPCAFLADSGEFLALKSCAWGGWSKDRGSFLVAVLANGDRIELELSGRQRGDTHERIMAYDRNCGWLVWVAAPIDDPPVPFVRMRFDRDDGKSVSLFGKIAECGLPGTLKRQGRRKNKSDLPHERHWVTWRLVGGETFIYCLEKYADQVQWSPQRKSKTIGVET